MREDLPMGGRRMREDSLPLLIGGEFGGIPSISSPSQREGED